MNVKTYYEALFNERTLPEDSWFDSFQLDSHCGIVCRQIMDKANELLSLCDPHPEVVDNIHRGVIAAMEIVCFG